MPDYFIYYAESNLVCFVVFLIMLLRDLLSADRQEKQIKFDHALVTFMAYFVSDAFWAAIESEVLPKTVFSVAIVNFTNFILMAAITYTWLRYVMAVEQTPNRDRPVNRLAALLPFIGATFALVTVYIAAPGALIDEELSPTMFLSIFQIAVPVIYIAAVLVYTLRRAKKEVSAFEKRLHLYVGLFPLLVVGGGLAEVLILNRAPIFCFSCTVLMLIFYILSMENQISMDPLTKLNNRGQLLRYVSQEANSGREGRKTFVIMIDVNDFKAINDGYGHSEGDRALTMIADSLRIAAKSQGMPSFLCRYGGDEFVIIAHPVGEAELDTFVKEIRSCIKLKCEEEDTPYLISVGIGIEEFTGGQDTFQKCIQRADNKLYLDKEQLKLRGDTSAPR